MYEQEKSANVKYCFTNKREWYISFIYYHNKMDNIHLVCLCPELSSRSNVSIAKSVSCKAFIESVGYRSV